MPCGVSKIVLQKGIMNNFVLHVDEKHILLKRIAKMPPKATPPNNAITFGIPDDLSLY
jgi:hypothetical protein